jgi:hypothetical protein
MKEEDSKLLEQIQQLEREIALKEEDSRLLEQFISSDAVLLDDQTYVARFDFFISKQHLHKYYQASMQVIKSHSVLGTLRTLHAIPQVQCSGKRCFVIFRSSHTLCPCAVWSRPSPSTGCGRC